MKRLLGSTMALVMALALLIAGCTSTPPTTAPTSAPADSTEQAAETAEPASRFDTPVEVSIALWEVNPDFVGKDDAIYKMVQEKFNVTINPISMTWDDYGQKVNTWVASDDMPDCFSIDVMGGKNYFQWIKDGVLKAIPENLDEYPNLKAMYEKPDVLATMVDGKFWCIPRTKADKNTAAWSISRGCIVRQDWMDKLGLKTPTSYEEFKTVLKALVNGDPDGNGQNDTLGIVTYDFGFLMDYIRPVFCAPAFTDWIIVDGKVQKGIQAPGAYEAMVAMRDLYKEGLIDPDFAIQKTDEGLAKFAAGKAAMATFQIIPESTMSYFTDKMKLNFPDLDVYKALGYIPYLPNQSDGKTYHFNTTSYWSEAYFSYKVDDGKLDRLLGMFDWWKSPEWINIAKNGLEGVDWKAGADGKAEILREKDASGNYGNLFDKYTFLYGFSFLAEWQEGPDFFYKPSIPAEVSDLSQSYYDWCMKNAVPTPNSFDIALMSTPLKDDFSVSVYEELIKFIVSDGSDPKAEWDAIMKKLEDGGHQAMLDEVTKTATEKGFIK